MKKVKLVLILMMSFGMLNAQSDTTAKIIKPITADAAFSASDSSKPLNKLSADTITIGNMVIVKGSANNTNNPYNRQRPNIVNNSDSIFSGVQQINENIKALTKGWLNVNSDSFKVTFNAPKPLSNVRTNWFSFDIGYANFQDKSPIIYYLQTPYGIMPPSGIGPDNLKLNNGKSSNFNFWIVQQKVNLYKHKLNLKYGVGFEMFNFRFEQPVSFRNDISGKMLLDNVSFSKNKLFAKYLTVPFQLNFKSDPKSNKSFYMSVGMSAGYLVDARNKQQSSERGKQKFDGNFNLNNWRVAGIGELGIGGIRLFGSYGLTNLFDKNATRFEFYPYSIGLRFSNF